MKRVGIIALLHESNTFLDEPTTIEHFRLNVLTDGDGVLQAFRGTPHEVGGFIDVIDQAGDVEAVGIFAARAMPFGTITKECWAELMTRLEAQLRSHLPLDGLLVAPHGATVAESAPDADGDWLQRVRAIVGSEVPIIGTLDLHANVSENMVSACDALFGYRTNPHLDQLQRGQDAAQLMLRTLNGETRPKCRLVQLPLCVNIERQATAEPQGARLWQHADRLQSQPGMVCVSCLYGFPYSDVHEMGASVVTVAEHDATLAQQAANEMATIWWASREDFRGQLISVSEGIQLALKIRQKAMKEYVVDLARDPMTLTDDRNSGEFHYSNERCPVGLLEMGDNVGGGSPGDGTWIAHGWICEGHGPLLTVIADAEAVQRAVDAGVNGQFTAAVGGRLDPERHGPPLNDSWTVLNITDGRFTESEARHGGYSKFDQGRTAVLRGESTGITVIATTLRVAPLSLQQVVSQGVNPNDFAAIVLKGVHAPFAAYAPVCSQLIRINTNGVTTADAGALVFHHRRRPMEPFEQIGHWQP
ncbi:MAG: M81 family metallopeptidase [Planctomycetaceae bacterium]